MSFGTHRQLKKAARIILVGAPGVGKGTQTERLLARFPQLASISSGDLLRENVRNKTPLGKSLSQDALSVGVMSDALTFPDRRQGRIYDAVRQSGPGLNDPRSDLVRIRIQGLALKQPRVRTSQLPINIPRRLIHPRRFPSYRRPGIKPRFSHPC